jgi:hypothetical protein
LISDVIIGTLDPPVFDPPSGTSFYPKLSVFISQAQNASMQFVTYTANSQGNSTAKTYLPEQGISLIQSTNIYIAMSKLYYRPAEHSAVYYFNETMASPSPLATNQGQPMDPSGTPPVKYSGVVSQTLHNEILGSVAPKAGGPFNLNYLVREPSPTY